MIKFVDEFRASDKCRELASWIRKISIKDFNIMEVCGGHTMAIRKNGLHKMIGEHVRFLSGPGCPVCVTAISDIDKVMTLAGRENVVLCTFGDLFYVPGSETSLFKLKAGGSDVRIVYSVHDVIDMAIENKEKEFVFVSIGFETTTPGTAAAILEARRKNISNFHILAFNKTMPKALRAIVDKKESKVDAFICPGHVSTITGTGIYDFIVEEYGMSCCISGFEPLDILRSVYMLVDLYEKGENKLLNAYERAVVPHGNRKAQGIMNAVFEPASAIWRGIGEIPGSGLKLKEDFEVFDAEKVFKIEPSKNKENPDCICGDILVGIKEPYECSLFGKACNPLSPKGACMVSSEGACAAWYKYSDE